MLLELTFQYAGSVELTRMVGNSGGQEREAEIKALSKGVGWRKSVLGRGDTHTAVKYFSAEPTHPLSTQPSHYSQWTEHRGK